MSDYTPFQSLVKSHGELWRVIHELVRVERQIISKSPVWADVVDLENVLRAAVKELSGIIARNGAYLENPRNSRPGADLALKAQLAKARNAVASALEDVADGHSHK